MKNSRYVAEIEKHYHVFEQFISREKCDFLFIFFSHFNFVERRYDVEFTEILRDAEFCQNVFNQRWCVSIFYNECVESSIVHAHFQFFFRLFDDKYKNCVIRRVEFDVFFVQHVIDVFFDYQSLISWQFVCFFRWWFDVRYEIYDVISISMWW